MSRKDLNDKLDALPNGEGTVSIDQDNGSAEVDVADTDRLGVRVRRVRVRREQPVDIQKEADALPDRLRSLPQPVEPVEVSPRSKARGSGASQKTTSTSRLR